MKRIGLIGGTGPEATLDYYAGMIETARKRLGSFQYPEIIVYSLSMGRLMELFRASDMPGVEDLLVEKLVALERAGADFAAIAAVTPHVVYEEVSSRSSLPLLSIVEATCDRAQEMGLERMGLLATGFTMASDFFQKPFARNGIKIVVPGPDERKLINKKIFTELEQGIVREETRQSFLEIASRMIREEGIDSLILGCTEIPLILDRDYLDIPFLNTAAIHVRAIMNRALAEEQGQSSI